MRLFCGRFTLDLARPVVMGVLNVTPDSFSDGGRYAEPGAAAERAREMVAEGAGIIDVGGESTRPGARPVPLEEELRRVLPVVERLAPELSVPVSVDTSKPEVMRQAIAVGAAMINDVRALGAPGAIEAVADSGVAACMMHMQGDPATMQQAPRYRDVVADVRAFLSSRLEACHQAGVGEGRLVVDPGFGFGKSLEHNLALLAQLDVLVAGGVPVLVGLSRKSMIGKIAGEAAGGRLPGSLALAVIAVMNGASIVRAHDVAETVEAVKVAAAVRARQGELQA